VNSILLVFLVVHYFLRPYKNHSSNILEFIASSVVLYTYNCVNYITLLGTSASYAVVIILVLVNLSVLGPILFFIVYDFLFKGANGPLLRLSNNLLKHPDLMADSSMASFSPAASNERSQLLPHNSSIQNFGATG